MISRPRIGTHRFIFYEIISKKRNDVNTSRAERNLKLYGTRMFTLRVSSLLLRLKSNREGNKKQTANAVCFLLGLQIKITTQYEQFMQGSSNF